MIKKRTLLWAMVLFVMVTAALLIGHFTKPDKVIVPLESPGSSEHSSPANDVEKSDESGFPNLSGGTDDVDHLPVETDIADYIAYDRGSHSVYIAGLRLFEEFRTEEFGYANEGTVWIDREHHLLVFSLKVSTGTVTGALDGPLVSFTMDLDSHTLTEKVFEPAPAYLELGVADLAQYSRMTIEPDDARLIEIGLYFKDFILQLENHLGDPP